MTQPATVAFHQPLFENKIPVTRPAALDWEALAETFKSVLTSGVVTKGPHLRAFEAAVAEELGVRHGVAVSSGTAGLMLTYQALDLSGEVIVPSFTFMATVSALIWANLTPVFADIDYRTRNIDPAAAERAITPRTSAIVAVHNGGNPADVNELVTLAQRHGLKIIFDAAHAFGSRYQGCAIGSQGDAHVFSLSPTKLVMAGEGGLVATNDKDLAQRIRVGREYGNRGDYDSEFAGINARLPELNAVLALHSLAQLQSAVRHRNQIASLYEDQLSKIPGIGFQTIRTGNINSYKDFAITVDSAQFGITRDELATALAADNIESRTYFDPPVHRQFAYRRYAPLDGALVNTDRISSTILDLPIWSDMDPDIASKICVAIKRAHELAPAIRG
jgi:dTDP-4-amino-4,6-dideoxygalactose transaminase